MSAVARLGIRPARLTDAGHLLEWANDPATRAASFDREPIAAQAHEAWLAGVLGDPGRRLWIAEEAGIPVGQVRVDRAADGVGVVSIGLAPSARGRGLGREILRLGLSAAAAELGVRRARAVVRRSNVPSRRLFEGAGFGEVARPASEAGLADALVLEASLPGSAG